METLLKLNLKLIYEVSESYHELARFSNSWTAIFFLLNVLQQLIKHKEKLQKSGFDDCRGFVILNFCNSDYYDIF